MKKVGIGVLSWCSSPDGATLVSTASKPVRRSNRGTSHHRKPQRMLNTSSCSGNRWLYILLIILGGLIPGLAVVASIQAQTTASARQADPDNAEQVALGQQVYASFCAGCHGSNLEGQPNWQKKLPLGNFPAPPHDETGHTTPCRPVAVRNRQVWGQIPCPHAIAAPCRPIKRCSPTPRPGLCWPLSKPLACCHPGAAGAAECW